MVDAHVTLCDSSIVPTPNGLLTTSQVAARLGLHLRKVQRMAETGDLPYAQKLPGPYGRYLFDAVLIDYLARQQQQEAKTA